MRPRHLYLHVPFCARRCSYCDFSIAVRSRVPVDAYVAGVRAELGHRFGGSEPWPLDTVYLGGGTPSRLGPAGVASLLAALRDYAALAPGAEVTLEANPDDVTDEAAARWVASGVNRVSLGVQSFSDDALRWMHRTHDAGRPADAVASLRRAGIENFSVDLIFSLPPEVPRSWSEDLDRALGLGAPHVSLYGLTVEPATPLARWRERGEVSEPPEERYEEEFLQAHDRLTGAGYDHYEVSNFGKPGLHSRHNSTYWSGAPYAGIGPAAHGFDGARRRWNVAPYAAWLRCVAAGDDPVEGEELLSGDNRVAERVYLGLRTSRGLALSPAEVSRTQPWVDAGWATVRDGCLRLTATGWLRLDAISASLTLDRSR